MKKVIATGAAFPYTDRISGVQRAIHLAVFTIFYNLLEGVVSLVLGGSANSIALIGFALDSFVESFSGLIVLNRFRCEAEGVQDSSRLESRALRGIGWSFFLLSGFILFESSRKLWTGQRPEPSPLGILLAIVSLVVMPVLAGKKFRAGKALKSGAMMSDSKQTIACMLLSVSLLLGLGLNALLGWWWADPVAGLTMIPWLVKEGAQALRGETCCD